MDEMTNETVLERRDVASPPVGQVDTPPATVEPTDKLTPMPIPIQDPRGFPEELVTLIQEMQSGGDREAALLHFIANQEGQAAEASDVMHWNRGAGVHLLFSEVLPGRTKIEKDEYMRTHFKAAYNTVRKDVRAFKRYRENPEEYFLYRYSIAVELSTLPNREDRDSVFQDALKEEAQPTARTVARIKAKKFGRKMSQNKTRVILPLSHFREKYSFDSNSTIMYTDDQLILALGHDGLRDADLEDIGKIINRHARTKIRLRKDDEADSIQESSTSN